MTIVFSVNVLHYLNARRQLCNFEVFLFLIGMQTCLYQSEKISKKCFHLHWVMLIASFMLVKALDVRRGMGRLCVWGVGGGVNE